MIDYKEEILQTFKGFKKGVVLNQMFVVASTMSRMRSSLEDYQDTNDELVAWLRKDIRSPVGTFSSKSLPQDGSGICIRADRPSPTTHFKLVLSLGNDAMQTRNNVATALRKVAARLEKASFTDDQSHKILDKNGNSVGQWIFTDLEE